ncbi:MAG: helix-turn-helix domain-containing protein [Clostridiales bacterium]|nr:helix-turn-helix domain-containing protein [Clostridiales bacterium]
MKQAISTANVGEILRLLRISFDLSISDLSDKTKISKSYISEIEKGIKTPSEKIIKNYSTGLNIPEKILNDLLNNYSQMHLPYQQLLLDMLKTISKL